MNPLPDRTVIVGVLATLGLCFALVFWFVKLQPSTDEQLQWRESPGQSALEQPGRPTTKKPGTPGEQSGANEQLL